MNRSNIYTGRSSKLFMTKGESSNFSNFRLKPGTKRKDYDIELLKAAYLETGSLEASCYHLSQIGVDISPKTLKSRLLEANIEISKKGRPLKKDKLTSTERVRKHRENKKKD